MDALDALKTRRSCRAYLDRPVDAQTLDTIIEAGRFAASGMGRQPVTFVAVTDPATVKQLSRMRIKARTRLVKHQHRGVAHQLAPEIDDSDEDVTSGAYIE